MNCTFWAPRFSPSDVAQKRCEPAKLRGLLEIVELHGTHGEKMMKMSGLVFTPVEPSCTRPKHQAAPTPAQWHTPAQRSFYVFLSSSQGLLLKKLVGIPPRNLEVEHGLLEGGGLIYKPVVLHLFHGGDGLLVSPCNATNLHRRPLFTVQTYFWHISSNLTPGNPGIFSSLLFFSPQKGHTTLSFTSIAPHPSRLSTCPDAPISWAPACSHPPRPRRA